MKKSVYEAMERAKKHSEDFPTIRVWVMDKPRKHAVVCASDFVQRERIVEGWTVLAEFQNGKRVCVEPKRPPGRRWEVPYPA